MKLLYVSSWHGTLEYDELSIFTELGIDWFSTGYYVNPTNPVKLHAERGPLNHKYYPDLHEELKRANPSLQPNGPLKLTKELVKKFDVIFLSHVCPYPWYLHENWELVKHKPVLWRTYGQENSREELLLQNYVKQGVKVVRISETTKTIPNFAGVHAVVRHIADETVYKDWNGLNSNHILTFNNYFNKRRQISNTDEYQKVVKNLPTKLYGCHNEGVPNCLGALSWADQIKAYQDCRVYFALGTKPGPVTYNLAEALMTGCPLITWGPKLGNYVGILDWSNVYEAHTLLENGVECFWSDDLKELRSNLELLLKDQDLCSKMSKAARAKALKLFSRSAAKDEWVRLFKTL
jgi:glycosyltransferase involved in cell wall biosynthesis